MPISPYIADLRSRIGTTLLMVPSVAAIVRDADGRILLMKSSDGGAWSLPAGAIDPGESPGEAVVREVREETGLAVEPRRVAAVLGGENYRHRYANGDLVEYTIVLFECTMVGGALETVDGEAEELCWFASGEMPALRLPYPQVLFDRPDSDVYFESGARR